MSVARVVTEPVGDTVEGVWCPDCLLSSIAARVVLIHVGRQTLIRVGQVCRRCGRQAPVR